MRINRVHKCLRNHEVLALLGAHREQVGWQQLMVEATGHQPVTVSPERARYSREHVGSEYIGWLHFQPVFAELAASQPDMFD